MAYQMIHLEIAYRLLEKFTWIVKREDFLLGAIAPDAVHFHDKYEVCLKEQSHLWNCGPKWGITLESEKWEKNVLAFWGEHKKDDNKDFIAGYCVHILTDWLNDIRIWSPFRNANIKGDKVEEIYHMYQKEAIGSDQWLYQNSSNTEKIMELLSQSKAHSITGCIEKDDIERQKKHILTEQYKDIESQDINGYCYCSKEIIMSFIEECVEKISEMI
ncbi:MAG: hypothetical protein IJN64_01565 [Lachnospiraceae bacterium]|nr:hypothetical protein [Lachnospiraceae bacterium]